MGLLMFREASTATAVGTFLSERNGLATVNYPRQIKRIAVTGSAAAGDCAFKLFLGQTEVGEYFNTSTGLAPVDAKDFQPIGWICDAGEPVRVMVTDASGTNVAQVVIETSP